MSAQSQQRVQPRLRHTPACGNLVATMSAIKAGKDLYVQQQYSGSGKQQVSYKLPALSNAPHVYVGCELTVAAPASSNASHCLHSS
jgi:hypothetical protein